MRYLLLLFILLPLKLVVLGQEHIIVPGVAQDGGCPHMGCTKDCCQAAWEDPSMRRNVVSLALVDPVSRQCYLFEASPDISEQLQLFRQLTSGEYNYLPRTVFVSHAHIGHYTGLMQFGREVMNTDGLTVYALPQMKSFLEQNGVWDQLVKLWNIVPVGVTDSMDLFSLDSKETKDKIHFIHLNHSTPVLYNKKIRQEILNRGFNIAEQGHNY